MQNTPASPANDTSDEIDLLALLGALIDRKFTIIFCTLAFAIAGAAYAVLTTPVYLANAVIQIEQKVQGVGSLLGQMDSGASSSAATTEIELLKSRTVIGQAVSNLKLDVTAEPRLFPVIGSYAFRRYQSTNENPVAAPFLSLERYAWGGEKLDVFELQVPTAYIGHQFILRAGEPGSFTVNTSTGQELFSGKVGDEIDQDGFRLQVAELTARPGTEFTLVKRNLLSTTLGYQGRIQASERGQGSGILAISMESSSPAEAVATLNEVSRLYVRQNVERRSAQAQQSLEFLQDQLPEVRNQVEKAEAALNAYQASAGSVNISLETQAVLDQVVSMDTAIADLMLKRSELERRFTREHPNYQALVEQLGQLEARRDQLVGRVGDLPETQQELLRLSRDVKVSTEIYTAMLNTSQELDVMRAGTVGNVRIIDEAVANFGPVKPKKATIVVLATLLGAMLGLAIALLRHILNRGIETPENIEKLGLPVYASIPFSKDQQLLEKSFRGKQVTQGSHLLAATNPADLAIESLRSLRTSLHFAMLEAKNNVLMISGPSPSVGKSFVSANLAAIVAQTGKKVVLIDGDMRKGYVHKLINKDPEPGLSGLLVSTHTLADVIHKTEIENLHFISRGQIPPNPSELLMHANFETLLQQLSKMYDMVIIDTPPILAVTDAALVGRLAGTSLIVTRFGMNPAREIQQTLLRFRNNGIDIKGAIFNAVEKKASAYGYGNYGYYQYEYKSDAK